MSVETSRLINDLRTLPDIVAGLGLGIAEAQKALNLTYLESLQTLAALLTSLMGRPEKPDAEGGDAAEARKVVEQLLVQLAPSRYQFTETTLTVRLDLSQTMTGAVQGGVGGGIGAVVVSAAMSLAYGMDYRGAAELRTVLHAVPAGASVFADLRASAEKLAAKDVELPPQKAVDQKLIDTAQDLFKRLNGGTPAPAIAVPAGGQAPPAGNH